MSALPTAQGASRRHDLDALRAFAMLLGVGLHAALPFTVSHWLVRDSQTSRPLVWFIEWVHGFRMPLFMLLSGFFTMMLYRRRGLRAVLRQRGLRVGVPLLLGVLILLPAQDALVAWANRSAATGTGSGSVAPASGLVAAVRRRDRGGLQALLAAGADPDRPDSRFGYTPLEWAICAGDQRAIRLLLDHGARVDAADRQGQRALHLAVYLARPDLVAVLIDAGADVRVADGQGVRPWDLTRIPWADAHAWARARQIHLPLAALDCDTARQQCRDLLARHGGQPEGQTPPSDPIRRGLSRLRDRYDALVNDARFEIQGRYRLADPAGTSYHLFQSSVFDYLWFLWFLLWLVLGFSAVVTLGRWLRLPRPPAWLVRSPMRWLWLVPLTMVPQYFMRLSDSGFGPDTSASLLPLPHVLVYYALFFGFGALYYDSQDVQAQLGRGFELKLTVAVAVFLPLGMATTVTQPLVSTAVQAVYAWAMCFGLMGLARRWLTGESPALRYLSDASYWIYLAHHPLIPAIEGVVAAWTLPVLLKFPVVLTLAVAIPLLTYHWFVRFTWIGWLLNGPRTRPGGRTAPVAALRTGATPASSAPLA